MAERLTHYTTDHDTIREWAEARGAKPTRVRGTGGRKGGADIGMIRLDFPGFSGARSLQTITWDDWFEAFDQNNLALAYQEHTADGQESNFNKIVGAEIALGRLYDDMERKSEAESRRASGKGKSRQGRQSSRRTSASRRADEGGRSRSAGRTGTTRSRSGSSKSSTRSVSSSRSGSRSSSAGRQAGAGSKGRSSPRGGRSSSSRSGAQSRSRSDSRAAPRR